MAYEAGQSDSCVFEALAISISMKEMVKEKILKRAAVTETISNICRSLQY